MKYFKYSILILLTGLFLMSCGVSASLKKANDAYEAGGYYKAARLYRKAAAKVDKDERG